MQTNTTTIEMSQNITTQDNAATAEPIYVVQQKRRVYGIEEGYHDNNSVWMDGESNEVSEEEVQEIIDCGGDAREVGYLDIWEFVQPFFTRAGAEAYIEANRHNLNEPRVYVESAYRNYEWQEIRRQLLAVDAQDRWISVDEALPARKGGWGDSFEVLATNGEEVLMAYITCPEEEEPIRWAITASTGMGFKGVTHWRHLPEPPK